MTRASLVLLAALIITRDDTDDARYRELGARKEFSSVVRIVSDSRGSGSGVLIAPRWVLTAAHVVHNRPIEQLTVIVGSQRIAAKRAVIHPVFLSDARGLDKTAGDHALIELAENALVTPSVLATVLPTTGTHVTLIGYGVGGPGAKDSAGTLRGAHNRVDQLGGTHQRMALADHLMLTDFDIPGLESRNALGSATPEPLEGLASAGDSGGGLFAEMDGRWQLIGTFSISMVPVAGIIAKEYAGGTNLFVGVAPHYEWIAQTIGLPSKSARTSAANSRPPTREIAR